MPVTLWSQKAIYTTKSSMSELGLSGKIQYIRQSIKKSLSRR